VAAHAGNRRRWRTLVHRPRDETRDWLQIDMLKSVKVKTGAAGDPWWSVIGVTVGIEQDTHLTTL
jgi:hypothetical protein